MVPVTISELLDTATRRLQGAVDDPRREAQALLCAVTGVARTALFARADDPVDPQTLRRVEQALDRRRAGEPLAYIAGRRGFWTLELEVTPDVLVPRPETELLVERALQHGDAAATDARPCRVVDLGTGSGAIALAIASERPAWQVTGIDVSAAALAVARRNAQRLGLARLRLLEGSWFVPVGAERFDLVISNPPYVAAGDPAMNDPGLRHEPRLALTPGADGLAALREITAQAPRHLAAGGWLLLEHGAGQAAAVRTLLETQGYGHVGSHRDLAGHERVTEGRWPGIPSAGSTHEDTVR
jgi:release factor glutamine methyltransferase